MTLAERLSEYVRAAFSGLWVVSHEPDDAVAELAGLCRREGWAPPAPRYTRGVLAKYAKLVGSAAEGAICG